MLRRVALSSVRTSTARNSYSPNNKDRVSGSLKGSSNRSRRLPESSDRNDSSGSIGPAEGLARRGCREQGIGLYALLRPKDSVVPAQGDLSRRPAVSRSQEITPAGLLKTHGLTVGDRRQAQQWNE
jgi:hypothetical protein